MMVNILTIFILFKLDKTLTYFVEEEICDYHNNPKKTETG